jgi:hypothetical protein
VTTATLTPAPSSLSGEGGPELPDPPPGADGHTAAAELLGFLREAGFTLTARDGRVYVEPRSKLSPAECGQIVALKPGLLAVLEEERWVRCQLCLNYADSGHPDDVQRLCGVVGCPYRKSQRGKR